MTLRIVVLYMWITDPRFLHRFMARKVTPLSLRIKQKRLQKSYKGFTLPIPIPHHAFFLYSIPFAPFPQSERLDQAIISNIFFTLLYPSCIYITPAGGGFCYLIYAVYDWRFISSGTILLQNAKSRGGTLVTRAYILRKVLTVEMYSQKKSRFSWTWTARNR